MSNIILTGAAGVLGASLRAPLAGYADQLVSSDIAPAPASLHTNETFRHVDITDLGQVEALLKGADCVVHLAAIPDESPFDDLLGPNFVGAYNVWEAAARCGVRRVIYASSLHAVGLHRTTAAIGIDAPQRPDSFYGLSKCFAENLASLYYAKRGVESVCLRICSCTEKPQNARALGTWLSRADLARLVLRAVDAPVVECAVVYGVSNNDRAPVTNSGAGWLGYHPQDNAEDYADSILDRSGDPSCDHYLGGPFAVVDLGESGVAHLQVSVTDSE